MYIHSGSQGGGGGMQCGSFAYAALHAALHAAGCVMAGFVKR